MSWSPTWDARCRRAVLEWRPDLLREGRAIEMRALGMIMFPDQLRTAWLNGEFGALGYAAEFLAAGITDDMAKTDPVLHHNLSRGRDEARRRGWLERLDAVRLHELESILEVTLANQAAEGILLSTTEVSEVRRSLAAQHLGALSEDQGSASL